jgi:class 3 adenylate cyclase
MTTAESRAERRNLTVLFADLVGSSGLAARLDPEDLQIILRSVQSCFREAVSKYQGQIARYLGDGVLAYFGFPIAHEDAAERAVSAALEMRASVAKLSFAYVSAPLQLHIGIATGLVLVGDLIGDGPSREFEVIGEAPNIAAWLQQHAKPDQILVSPQTRVLLHELFELSDEGEHHVKGQAEPVRVWGVIQRRTFQTRFDAYRSSRLTPFVGRDPELQALLEEFGRVEQGEGRIVSIYGEAGIGKSRLIDRFCEKLGKKRFRKLVFQCSSYHSFSPWYPIIRHLEDAASVSAGEPGPIRFTLFERFLASELTDPTEETVYLLAQLLSLPIPDTYPAFELTPQQQKRRTLSTLIELFRAQAKLPLVLVFEDIHWIDPTSLELLDLAREELKDLPVMIIASFRPEFEAPWIRTSEARSIWLNPLPSEYAASVVNALWGEIRFTARAGRGDR